MDGTRPGEPLTDPALDRELETALGVEPSPEFLARVRTRIASEPEPSPWRLADVVSGFCFLPAVASAKAGSRTRQWAVEPLWGVAIVGIMLAVVVPRWMRDAKVPSKAVIAPIAEPVEIAPVEASLPAEPPISVVPVRVQRQVDRINELPLRLSTPMFSEEERRVFEQYFAAVEEGLVPPHPADTQVSDSLGVGQVLTIEPMAIDPLPQLSARGQTEGEAKW